MQIKFEIDGVNQLSRNLRIAAANIGNLKEFHKDAVNIIEKRSLKVFSGKGLNVQKSVKWKSLAASTKKARSKRRGYYKQAPKSPSTLVWTGNLKESRRKKSTNNYGLFEFTAPYAQYHQKGGKNLPKRVLIDLDNTTNTEIVRALQTKINKDLKIFGYQE